MNFVTKSVTIPNVPQLAFDVLTDIEGPLTLQNLFLQLLGYAGRSYQEGTGMVYEVSGTPEVVDAALATAQEQVADVVGLIQCEALLIVLRGMLSL